MPLRVASIPPGAPRRHAPWRSPLFWVVLAGLGLRLAYLAEQQAASVLFYQPLLDEQEMATAARQLLAGAGFGREPLFKAPLYPLYLAGVMAVSGEGWFFLARLVQHLLGAALALLAYDVARRGLGGPAAPRARLAGCLAAAALAFYGPLIRLEDSLILDFFAVFLQSAMLWALVRLRTTPRPAHEKRWAALAGLLAALAWLNRPTLTPLLPFLALWLLARPLRRMFFKNLQSAIRNRKCRRDAGATFHIPHSAFRNPQCRRDAGATFRNPQSAIRNPQSLRRLACAALFLSFPFLALALVYVRNAAVGGEGMALPWQGGYSFYYANGAKANGKYYLQDAYSLARTGNPTRELAEAGWRQAVAQGQAAPAPAGRAYHAINQYWQSRALAEIRQAPARWLALMARKVLYLATAREIFNFEVYEVQRRLSWILCCLPLSFGLLWPFALAGAARPGAWPRRRRGLFGLLWLYTILLGGAIALYFVSGRLRLPLVFPVAILAAGALASLLCGSLCVLGSPLRNILISHSAFRIPHWNNPQSAIRNPQSEMPAGRRRYNIPHSAFRICPLSFVLCPLFLLLAGFLMSYGDWFGVRSEKLNQYEYARLSNAAWRAGENEKALAYADSCEREAPGYPGAALLRGQALYSLSRIPDAAAAFADSLRRLPQDPVAPYNLGIIAYYDRPDPARAAGFFAEALHRQPAYHQAAWMGALAQVRLGRPDRARELLRPYLPPASAARPPQLLLTTAIALSLVEKDSAAAQQATAQMEKLYGPPALKSLAGELKLLKLKLN